MSLVFLNSPASITSSTTISADSIVCDFSTAFEKGVKDLETGSYGANLDRFCNTASSEERAQFMVNYELGRKVGPQLKELGFKDLPQSKEEMEEFLLRGDAQSKIVELESELQKKDEKIAELEALVKELEKNQPRLSVRIPSPHIREERAPDQETRLE